MQRTVCNYNFLLDTGIYARKPQIITAWRWFPKNSPPYFPLLILSEIQLNVSSSPFILPAQSIFSASGFIRLNNRGSPLSIILNVTDNVKNAASLERNLRRIHHASGNLAAGPTTTAKQILRAARRNISTDSPGITAEPFVSFRFVVEIVAPRFRRRSALFEIHPTLCFPSIRSIVRRCFHFGRETIVRYDSGWLWTLPLDLLETVCE